MGISEASQDVFDTLRLNGSQSQDTALRYGSFSRYSETSPGSRYVPAGSVVSLHLSAHFKKSKLK